MIDVKAYLHVPYLDNGRDEAGWDCWGLVRAVYAAEAGIDLPLWDTIDSRDEAGRAVAMVKESAAWLPIEPGSERSLDVLLLRESGRPCHCGVVISPPHFLHARRGAGTCVSSYRSGDRREQWWRRLLGIYRHPALA